MQEAYMNIFENLVNQRLYHISGNLKENGIEFLQNDTIATFSFSNRHYVNRIKKLKESHPDDVDIAYENKDGSIFGHIPISWIKINPPREISEENRMKKYFKKSSE